MSPIMLNTIAYEIDWKNDISPLEGLKWAKISITRFRIIFHGMCRKKRSLRIKTRNLFHADARKVLKQLQSGEDDEEHVC